MKELILIRGPSGSGKTFVAMRQMTLFVFEADHFFVTNTKDYDFRQDLLKEAHAYCLGQAAQAMFCEERKVVVSNTFTTKWEMQPYLDLANKLGYNLTVYRTAGPWNAAELAKHNEHGVPERVIEKQIARFEPFDGEIELKRHYDDPEKVPIRDVKVGDYVRLMYPSDTGFFEITEYTIEDIRREYPDGIYKHRISQREQ